MELTAALIARLDDPTEVRTDLEDEIIRLNLVVATQEARRYDRRGIDPDDLRQVAYLALVKAVRRYDTALATDFLGYVVPCIRGELRRWFRDAGWMVRPPRSVQELQARITRVSEELGQELGRSPAPATSRPASASRPARWRRPSRPTPASPWTPSTPSPTTPSAP